LPEFGSGEVGVVDDEVDEELVPEMLERTGILAFGDGVGIDA
jgi:hypothetical protein